MGRRVIAMCAPHQNLSHWCDRFISLVPNWSDCVLFVSAWRQHLRKVQSRNCVKRPSHDSNVTNKQKGNGIKRFFDWKNDRISPKYTSSYKLLYIITSTSIDSDRYESIHRWNITKRSLFMSHKWVKDNLRHTLSIVSPPPSPPLSHHHHRHTSHLALCFGVFRWQKHRTTDDARCDRRDNCRLNVNNVAHIMCAFDYHWFFHSAHFEAKFVWCINSSIDFLCEKQRTNKKQITTRARSQTEVNSIARNGAESFNVRWAAARRFCSKMVYRFHFGLDSWPKVVCTYDPPPICPPALAW